MTIGGLVAAGAQRALGELHLPGARLQPVAAGTSARRSRRGRTRPRWRRPARWSTISVATASARASSRLRTSASTPAALGHDVDRRAAVDRADVGGRLRRSRRPSRIAAIARGGGGDRAAAGLRRGSRHARRAPRSSADDPVVGAARRPRSRRSAWRGRTRSRTRCAAGRRRTPCAPRSATSSQTVNSELDAAPGGGCAAAAGGRARASPRPRPCCRRRGSRRWRSPSRRRPAPARPAPVSGTVSRCAHSRMLGRRAARPPDPREQVAGV